MKYESQKGFTLIELLVVIAIVAVLSVVVILTLNPAELLRQARDSNRVSDMATLRSAISLYLADVGVPSLAGNYNNCYMTFATTSCTGAFGSITGVTTTATSSLVNGNGWLPVNFTAISSGAPLGNLPIDPLNTATFFYGYAATSSNLSFKIVATGMESTKYGGASSPNNVVATDGGLRANMYEVGTNLNL